MKDYTLQKFGEGLEVFLYMLSRPSPATPEELAEALGWVEDDNIRPAALRVGKVLTTLAEFDLVEQEGKRYALAVDAYLHLSTYLVHKRQQLEETQQRAEKIYSDIMHLKPETGGRI
ncbi:hypothetical protein KQI63_05960 [bacterium]|nr:hypothetical protein [bacterium]